MNQMRTVFMFDIEDFFSPDEQPLMLETVLFCPVLRWMGEAMKAAGFADPESMASRYSSQLSGGERQRISLASRIIMKPRVLLLDEPTAHVDAASEQMILNTVQACLAQGTTVICATHDRELFKDFPTAREVKLRRI